MLSVELQVPGTLTDCLMDRSSGLPRHKQMARARHTNYAAAASHVMLRDGEEALRRAVSDDRARRDRAAGRAARRVTPDVCNRDTTGSFSPFDLTDAWAHQLCFDGTISFGAPKVQRYRKNTCTIFRINL